MIVNHSDDGGEIHSRFNDQENHIEITMIASMGAMITLCFSQGNFNELVKTMRRLSEAFDEGRHERDVQRWIDWAEENRGSPKLKAYIKGKANELIDKQIRRTLEPINSPNGLIDRGIVRKPDDVDQETWDALDDRSKQRSYDEFMERERAEEWDRKFAKGFEDAAAKLNIPINRAPPPSAYIRSEPREAFAHEPERCPSDHWNRGDDICEDCGEDLNPPAEPTPPVISVPKSMTLYECLGRTDCAAIAAELAAGRLRFHD